MSRKPFVMPKRLSPKVARSLVSAGQKKSKALQLYLQGWSLRRIAADLGYAGPSGAHKAIRTAIKDIPAQDVSDLRAGIQERSSLMLEELWPLAMNRKASVDQRLSAMDRVIKIDKETRQMNGLDAPAATVQLTAEIATQDVRTELLDRLSRLADAAAASEDPQPT